MTPDGYEKILVSAFAAADAAIAQRFKDGYREQPFNCGFAWVTIGGREPLATYCKKMTNSEVGQSSKFSRAYALRYGDKGYPNGWQWWKPGSWPNDAPDRYMQDMDFHIAGARAFQAVLAEHGIVATVGARLD